MARMPMYEIEIHHRGLNKYRHIRGSDPRVVRQKALVQEQAWEEQWERKQEADKKRTARDRQVRAKEELRQIAEERTVEAEDALQKLRSILAHAIPINDAINWDKLIRSDKFPARPPRKPQQTDRDIQNSLARPSNDSPDYKPRLGFITWLVPPLRRKRMQEAEEAFRTAFQKWETAERESAVRYELALAAHNKAHASYEQSKLEFYRAQDAYNEAVREKQHDYMSKSPGAILDYCETVLNNSEYPDCFPKSFDIEYREDERHLIIEYMMPSPENTPRLKEVRFVASKNNTQDINLSDREFNSLYDELVYQTAIRTVHEVIEADVVDMISIVSFNGYVTSLDRATGHESTKCILSLQVGKPEFLQIDLARVDPRACFKALKGIASSKLHTVTAIPPMITIDKEDRRFIDAYGVADGLDDSTNIAAMDWEDFEHLIRELFEKEFQKDGGEVKVTQASRDGGVDAIAFDPDPIRGGKIVIQAKRYTNTVGVSAVRDLYGTVMNEGATKGILVTTADYGPDAYEFARGKPLTLLNGSNLLHLLEKHGHRAKIDIAAARMELASN